MTVTIRVFLDCVALSWPLLMERPLSHLPSELLWKFLFMLLLELMARSCPGSRHVEGAYCLGRREDGSGNDPEREAVDPGCSESGNVVPLPHDTVVVSATGASGLCLGFAPPSDQDILPAGDGLVNVIDGAARH